MASTCGPEQSRRWITLRSPSRKYASPCSAKMSGMERPAARSISSSASMKGNSSRAANAPPDRGFAAAHQPHEDDRAAADPGADRLHVGRVALGLVFFPAESNHPGIQARRRRSRAVGGERHRALGLGHNRLPSQVVGTSSPTESPCADAQSWQAAASGHNARKLIRLPHVTEGSSMPSLFRFLAVVGVLVAVTVGGLYVPVGIFRAGAARSFTACAWCENPQIVDRPSK